MNTLLYFSGSDLWRDKTPTWITSTLYNINCSFPLSSSLLHLPYSKIFEVCRSISPQSRDLKQGFFLLPPSYKETQSKWYFLTLFVHNRVEYGSIVGTLKSSILSNKLCRNALYVWYKIEYNWVTKWKRFPMKCVKLTFNQIVQNSFISHKGNYRILLYLENSFITFKIHSVAQIMEVHQMEYQWEHRKQARENYKNYTVFLLRSEYSWNEYQFLKIKNNYLTLSCICIQFMGFSS